MKPISQEVLQELVRAAGAGHVRQKEPMKLHTTMKVGGEAALFLTPETVSQIASVIQILRREQIPFFLLGNGSNVICKDTGYSGAVICLSSLFTGYQILSRDEGFVLVSVKAGTENKQFSDACILRGLSGFEFASGIPGTVGGATAMNAGAYDGEMKQIVHSVQLLDEEGDVISLTAEQMQFGYRRSYVTDRSCVILETVLKLREDEPGQIRARVEELTRRREEKQPLEYPSCGSTFKRPEGYYAGKLISDAGLKGYRLGGAQVSEKHAGFVINREQASAQDILDLIAHVQKTVREQAGVELECEVKILG